MPISSLFSDRRARAMLSHRHLFIPGAESSRTPLLLLHGSGGTERDMVALAARLSPESMATAVRGAVPWEGGFAFFRRFEDRSIDESNLLDRAGALAEYVAQIGVDHRFPKPPIAVGFSNGAIMAAALLMLHPGLLSGAVLFRPLLPFAADPDTRIPGTPVLIIDGRDDRRRSPGDGARLAQRMTSMGASVTRHELPTGHSLVADDLRLARAWLAPLL
jgi:phospholipase/carboxylesterase